MSLLILIWVGALRATETNSEGLLDPTVQTAQPPVPRERLAREIDALVTESMRQLELKRLRSDRE